MQFLGTLISGLADFVLVTSSDFKMFPKPGAIQQQAFGLTQSETTVKSTVNQVASVTIQTKEEVFLEKSPVPGALEAENIQSNPDMHLSVVSVIRPYQWILCIKLCAS